MPEPLTLAIYEPNGQGWARRPLGCWPGLTPDQVLRRLCEII
jgi:hypothetical protein